MPVIRRNRGTQTPLGSIIDHSGADQFVSNIIRKVANVSREERTDKYLHVSDILNKCVRKRALHEYSAQPAPTRSLNFCDMVTFAQGDAIHDLVKALSRQSAPEYVWGKWSCKCGYCTHNEPCTLAETDTEETCPYCLSKVDVYQEVSFADDDWWVVGNPDLIFKMLRTDAYYATEIKSISEKQYDELKRPKPEHVLQLLFYWHLMRRKGMNMVDQASVFYVNKGWKFGGANMYKEFIINPGLEGHRLEPYIEDARAYKTYKLTGELPPRIQCASRGSPDAKKCHMVDLCF